MGIESSPPSTVGSDANFDDGPRMSDPPMLPSDDHPQHFLHPPLCTATEVPSDLKMSLSCVYSLGPSSHDEAMELDPMRPKDTTGDSEAQDNPSTGHNCHATKVATDHPSISPRSSPAIVISEDELDAIPVPGLARSAVGALYRKASWPPIILSTSEPEVVGPVSQALPQSPIVVMSDDEMADDQPPIVLSDNEDPCVLSTDDELPIVLSDEDPDSGDEQHSLRHRMKK